MIALRHDVLRSRSGGIARDRRNTPQRKQSGVVTRPQDAKRATRVQPLTARTAWYHELAGKPQSYRFPRLPRPRQTIHIFAAVLRFDAITRQILRSRILMVERTPACASGGIDRRNC